MAKVASLRGKHTGLGAPEPLKPAEEFVFLCNAPCMTLSEELIELHLQGSAREPLSLVGLGRLSRAWALASVEGREGAKD